MKRNLALIILLFNFMNTMSQDSFYVRCVDADNLEQISNFNIKISSKNVKINHSNNGLTQLLNFKKGEEIIICAENYADETYQRPDKRLEMAIKRNNERIWKSGDTLVIELLLKNELLIKRWEMEDLKFPLLDTTNVITKPDHRPSFIDELEFKKILYAKLHFPQHVIRENVQGSVYISAIVETDGSLTHFKIVKTLDPHLDRIALRAVRNSNFLKLNPAIHENIPVRSTILIPLNFNLN